MESRSASIILSRVNVEDTGRRRRIWTTLFIAMAIASVIGFCGFVSEFTKLVSGFVPRDLVWEGIRTGLNTAAVAFWIAFPILYRIRVPKSAAALVWERMLQRAEEMFDRHAAARGRKRWWR